MLTWLIRRKIDAFEEEYEYDMGYARELLGTSLRAMLLFHKATGLGEFREVDRHALLEGAAAVRLEARRVLELETARQREHGQEQAGEEGEAAVHVPSPDVA